MTMPLSQYDSYSSEEIEHARNYLIEIRGDMMIERPVNTNGMVILSHAISMLHDYKLIRQTIEEMEHDQDEDR